MLWKPSNECKDDRRTPLEKYEFDLELQFQLIIVDLCPGIFCCCPLRQTKNPTSKYISLLKNKNETLFSTAVFVSCQF